MPYFGDQSDGTLHVTSGTHNLQLNRKYQFRSVKVDAGATLSTNSPTGSVLYILAHESIEINGTIDVSNKVNHGSNPWAVTIDGAAYSSPGVAPGAIYAGHSIDNKGFGSGGDGVDVGAAGGAGGSGGSSPSGGGGRNGSRTTNGTTTLPGNNGSQSGGGGGGVWVRVSNMAGYVSGSARASSGAGASSFGGNGANAGYAIVDIVVSGGGSGGAAAGGGGGGGGRAGRAGIHVVLRAPRVVVNGQVITRGSDGGNGGNGGRSRDQNGWINYWGGPGLGGGGGHGGDVRITYATELTNNGTYIRDGGTGGIHGTGSFNNQRYEGRGSSGRPGNVLAGFLQPSQYPYDYTNLGGIPSGAVMGTLDITTQAVDVEQVGGVPSSAAIGQLTIGRNVTEAGSGIESQAEMGDSLAITQSPPPPPPPTDWEAIGKEDEKVFVYKVYSPDGQFMSVWTDVHDDPQFTQHLNTPGTTMTVQLARSPNTTKEARANLVTEGGDPILTEEGQRLAVTYETNNNVGLDTDVDLNLNVDVYVHYGEYGYLLNQDGEPITTEDGEKLLVASGAPMGVRVFSGFILDYESVYGEETGVTVTLASHGYELSHELIRSGETINVNYSAQDHAAIIKSILDTNPGRMSYDIDSIQNTGQNVSAKFQLNTKLEGIKSVFEQTPDGWYWFGNPADNLVYLRQRSATPRHTFIKGKHIKSMRLKRTMEGLTNKVYFVGGEKVEGNPATTLFKKYQDTASQAQWRVGLERITDRRYTIDSSAQNRSMKLINSQSQPIFTTPVTISSARYDLESIKVGDTVGFANFGNFVDSVVLQIVALTYTPTAVTLELGNLLERQVDSVAELENDLSNEQYQKIPDQPS